MDKKMNRMAQGLERLRRGRRTTLPTAEDQERSAAGPPHRPLEEMVRASLQERAWASYHFVGPVSAEQLREDAAAWFPEAPEYVERVALLREERDDLFPESPCRGRDLLSRLQRLRVLERARDEAQAFMEAADRTLKVERADLLCLADMHVQELDLQVRRPLLDEERRSDLLRAAAFPLRVWRARLEKMQASQKKTARAQAALAEAQSELAALKAERDGGAEASPAIAAPPPPAPPRRGRSRRR